MIKAVLSVLAICGLAAAVMIPSPVRAQSSQLTGPAVNDMVKNMGYTTKVLEAAEGKEKYEFLITRDGFDVPIAFEVSASKNYLWLTVFLGKTTDLKDYASIAPKLLKSNHDIQPSFFYVTSKENLMLGIALENRGIDAAVLRRCIDKIAKDTTSTSKLWNP